MTSTLYIRLSEDLDAPVAWQQAEAGAFEVPVHHTPMGEIAVPETGAPVVVFAPAARVALAQTEIQARNRAQLLKAVPFALEEELAAPVEDLHFGVQVRRNEPALVAAVDRSWLEHALERFQSVGIAPTAVVPEILCLPFEEKQWTLLLEQEALLFRTALASGFSVEPENMVPVLHGLRQGVIGQDEKPVVRLIDLRATGRDSESDDIEEALTDLERTEDDTKLPLLNLLAREYRAQRPLNLLQGDFAVEADWKAGWQRWRLAGLLAVLTLSIHLIGVGLENQRLAKRATALEQQMESLYREVFPEAERVVDPAVEMRNRLRVLRQQTGTDSVGFLDLLAGSGKHLLSDSKVNLKQLRYRNGSLELDVQADTIERLESIQQRLKEAALNADLPSVTREGQGFQGRVVVTGGA